MFFSVKHNSFVDNQNRGPLLYVRGTDAQGRMSEWDNREASGRRIVIVA